MNEPVSKPAVSAGAWNDAAQPARKRFTGPVEARAEVRTDFAKQAWADVVQHARESLEAEVCGVLVGLVCVDDQGLWVEVSAAIRGHAAANGQAHVTFTHETWERIHSEREKRFPRLMIVGWYHSHPGFGVEFSEMDAFIHRNFFAGPAQLAMVVDPVAGREAICINGVGGIAYLDRCWVDGRERRLEGSATAAQPAAGGNGSGQARIDALEARVGHLVGALDDMRNRIWSYYLIVGMCVVMSLMLYVGWQMWMAWRNRYEPPEVINEVSIPIQVGDQQVMMLARIYGWKVPDGLNVLLQEQLRAQAEAAVKAELEAKAASDAKAADDAKDAQPAAPPVNKP